MQRSLFLLLLHFVCLSILAVPARPGRRLVTLPDGTSREVIIRGDEHCHWLETPDGLPVGQRVNTPSLLQRQQAMLQHPRYTAPQAAAGNFLLEGSFPTTGKRRLLALLINFANTTPTFSREHFDSMLNEEGYNGVGSFRDYYLDQSRGQLDIHTTVTPWITVSQPKQFYNIDNTPSLISEALKQLEGTINLRDYDNNGDGILDGLIVIHAGEGQEASGNATDIWSHSSTIYGLQQDGVSLFRYTIEPELLHGSTSTIGVFCHEFGHNLGALDYYDTNYSSDGAYGGTGPWDIMGEGAWNGSGGLGTHPAPFTAWQRWQFGWITPTTLSESLHISIPVAETLLTESDDIYLMPTTTEGDYFILENVQNHTPWTSDIPGHGLLVTHVIESIVRQRMSMNTINATYPQGIYTVCADAHNDPVEDQPASYGDLTSSATPFPGTRNHNTFSDETLPSTHSQDGRFGYVALHHITEQADGTLTFDFVKGDAPQAPLLLTATVTQGSVRLSWFLPDTQEPPVSCNIYRNGTHLVAVDAEASGHYTFTDTDNNISGLVSYSVDATYTNGLASATTSVTTRIPPQIATAFQGNYDAESQHFLFSWNLPNEVTRCTNNLHYELVDHYATTFRYAHRFRADELLPFIGREVRSITFLPQQRSTDATYTISVWRMPSQQNQTTLSTIPADILEPVAQRKVTEFSPSYLRTTPFVNRPKIERGYDYLIGVEMTTTGLAEIVTDQAELQQGLGNMMSINGGTWQADPLAQGNYILAATLSGSMPVEEAIHQLLYREGSTGSSIFEPFATPFVPDTDLTFPLGFTLYADGCPIAETTGSSLLFPITAIPVSEECTSVFQLVSTFKQGNESHPLSIDVPYDIPTGLHPSIISPTTPSYDLSGRRLLHHIPSKGIVIKGGKKVIN